VNWRRIDAQTLRSEGTTRFSGILGPRTRPIGVVRSFFMVANATLLGLVTGAMAKEKAVMPATKAIFLWLPKRTLLSVSLAASP